MKHINNIPPHSLPCDRAEISDEGRRLCQEHPPAPMRDAEQRGKTSEAERAANESCVVLAVALATVGVGLIALRLLGVL